MNPVKCGSRTAVTPKGGLQLSATFSGRVPEWITQRRIVRGRCSHHAASGVSQAGVHTHHAWLRLHAPQTAVYEASTDPHECPKDDTSAQGTCAPDHQVCFLAAIIIHYYYVCSSGFTAVASFELACVSKFLNSTVPVAVSTTSTPWIGAQNTVKGATGSHSEQSWWGTHVSRKSLIEAFCSSSEDGRFSMLSLRQLFDGLIFRDKTTSMRCTPTERHTQERARRLVLDFYEDLCQLFGPDPVFVEFLESFEYDTPAAKG